jgi:hypothetical protein
MAVATGYIYGDSTPSPLKIDYIAFLRAAFDFSVEVLLCDARLTDAAQRITQLAETTERDIEGAEVFAAEVSRALDRVTVGDRHSMAARCALKIRQGAIELIRSEAEAARAAVVTEKARAEQAEPGERASCARALESLILRHTLPETVSITTLRIEGGTHYAAELHGRTAYGIEWVVALEIPEPHPLANILRVDRILERLEIDAPEEAGWIHKETKVRPQRFDRLHLAALTVDPTETIINLRAAPDGTGAGFDLSFKHDLPAVRLFRIREGEGPADSPYDATGENVAKLRSLHDALVAMAGELAQHKKTLLSASLDDTPVEQLERPRILAERLIMNIAPTVQQISKRSLAPGELVLKRLLSDNRREELFVSKAELAAKLEPLSMALRRAFEPFKLWEPPPPPHRPEPIALNSELPQPEAPAAGHPSKGPSL